MLHVMDYHKRTGLIALFSITLAIFALPLSSYAQDIQTGSIASAPRIAPGERLPIRVKLSNFGSTARTDVTVTYDIISADGKKVLAESETVAVETTATYIHTVTLPNEISPGMYAVQTSVVYSGQKAPAVGSYQFTVERKLAGVFVSEIIRYATVALAGLGIAFVVLRFVERRHTASLAPHEYSNMPRDVRIYYEMIEDVIREMRFHEGDAALAMAAEVKGLAINQATGKVMQVTGDPAEVVASLVSEYEQRFGRKVDMSFGNKRENRAVAH